MDAAVEELLNTQRRCIDCANCVNPEDESSWHCCNAPQLAEVLDDVVEQNTLTRCDAARDFKVACGHSARWYIKRG